MQATFLNVCVNFVKVPKTLRSMTVHCTIHIRNNKNTSDGSKRSLPKPMRLEYDALRWLDSQHINQQRRTVIGLSLIRLLHWAFQWTEEQVGTQETKRKAEKMADRFSRFNEERDFQVKKNCWNCTYPEHVRWLCILESRALYSLVLFVWAAELALQLWHYNSGIVPIQHWQARDQWGVLVAFQFTSYIFKDSKKYPNGRWSLRSVVIWPLVFDSGMLLIWDDGRITAGSARPGTKR